MADDWEGVEEIDAETFLKDGGKDLKQSPVQRIRITNIKKDQIEQLAESPYLDSVTHLDLSGNRMPIHGADWLLDSKHLDNVAHLDMSGNPVGGFALIYLTNNPHLQNLRDLRMNDCGFGWAVLDSLTEAIDLGRRLEHLELKGPPGPRHEFSQFEGIGKHGAKMLARSNYFRPEMTIAVDGFEGRFEDFQDWALPLRRRRKANLRINPAGTLPDDGRSQG